MSIIMSNCLQIINMIIKESTISQTESIKSQTYTHTHIHKYVHTLFKRCRYESEPYGDESFYQLTYNNIREHNLTSFRRA